MSVNYDHAQLYTITQIDPAEALQLVAMDGFEPKFLEFEPTGIASVPVVEDTTSMQISVPPKYAVVFLVEATGKLERHMPLLKSAYISPVLSYFKAVNSADGDSSSYGWIKDAWYGFVFYYSGDAPIGQETYCGIQPTDNEEAVLEWFDHIPADRASFQLSYECCFLEALSTGVRYMHRLISKHLKDQPVEKHFIVVGQSTPFEDAVMTNPNRPRTVADAPNFLLQEDIHFSVICTRRNKFLREIFEGTQHLSSFVETSANVNPMHMVLLNNITIRPVPEKASPSIPLDAGLISPATQPMDTTPVVPMEQQLPARPQTVDLSPAPAPLERKESNSILSNLLDSSGNLPVPKLKSPLSVADVLSPRNVVTPQEAMPAMMDPSAPMFPKPSESPRPLPPQQRASPLPIPNLPQPAMDMFSTVPRFTAPVSLPTVPTPRAGLGVTTRPPSVSVTQIADTVKQQFPRPGAPDMRQFNSPLTASVPSFPHPSSAGVAPPQGGSGRIHEGKCIVWEGIMEWASPRERVAGQPATLVQQQCEIWVPAPDIIRAERWPPKLGVQFLPNNFIQHMKAFMDSPIKIHFAFKSTMPNGDVAVRELIEYMLKRSPSLGCILIPASNHIPNLHVVTGLHRGEATTVELRVIVFIFNQAANSFQGLIPRDQVGFVDSLRQMLQSRAQQQQQQHQQQQQQNAQNAGLHQMQQQPHLQQQMMQSQQQQQAQLSQNSQQMPQQYRQMQNIQQFNNMGGGAMNTMGMDSGYAMQQQQMQQQQLGQSMGMSGFQTLNPGMGQQQMMQEPSLQQRLQQQQQMFLMQQRNQQQDPQLRQLLQNASPNMHSNIH
ncbi:mediator of RNA polymerase II transcription subunit 25-like isoform X2 [Paramacrobiotus metropolitanus]|nr:mediator of RNA polymerase II transcription subunit 25-like isoform X2 [Paramacrobiotus metropolitanus]